MASGEGLVFNPGERVEGYSNFLWTVSTGVAIWLGADPIAFSRALSYVSGVGIILLLWKLSGYLTPSAHWAWRLWAPLATLIYCPLSIWSNSGLETIFFAFLLLAGLERLAVGNNKRMACFAAGVIFGLASITRAEGLGYLVVALLAYLLKDVFADGSIRQPGYRAMAFLFGGLLVFAPVFAWRWHYYGAVIPNSVAAKSSALTVLNGRPFYWLPALLVTREGTPYIWGWLMSFGLIPAALAALSLSFSKNRMSNICIASVIFSSLIVTWSNFGDWMPDWRLLVPVTPLVFLLAWIFTSINKLRIWARSVGLRHTAGSLLWAPWIIV